MTDIEYTDDVMEESLQELQKAVVGRKIVSVDTSGDGDGEILLDNGRVVSLLSTGDCCAYTEVEAFFINPDKVDHVITGVTQTDDYNVWHIVASMDDILTLTVGWSAGSGYYTYGFTVLVEDPLPKGWLL